MILSQVINDRVLALFDLRATRASSWRNASEKTRLLESLAGSSVAQARIIRLARLLCPHNAIEQSKIRLGSNHDGGYICLNDFDAIAAAFSFGVAQNDDWDLALAERGIDVQQFDHTIDAPPHTHQNLYFHKRKIVPTSERGLGVETISDLLEKCAKRERNSVILKIDIEGDEWKVFNELASQDMDTFSQVICEFHGFSAVLNDIWYERALTVLERLDRAFSVVHVHGNNCSPWTILGGVPFPELLEVTYASRSRYEFKPADEIFPTLLDSPNDPNVADFFLGRFKF